MPKRVAVEVLHSEGCGHWEAVRDALLRVAERESVPVTPAETLVENEAKAKALRFPGSPTVRIEGQDLQPEVEARADYGLG